MLLARSRLSASTALPPHVLSREVDGQLVLLDVSEEQYYGLDEIGARIVSRVTATSLDAALAELAEEYEVEPATLRSDAAELLDELVTAGLLLEADPG